MTSSQERIEQFKSITGADDHAARFYLDAAGWNLETATSTFFDSGGVVPQQTQQPTAGTGGSRPSSGGSSGGQPRTATPPTTSGGARPRVTGFSDLRNEPQGKTQNYYTGGKTSGMMVEDPQGPDAEEEEGDDMISRLMHQARKNGPPTDSIPEPEPEKFTGSGYRLGNTDVGPSTTAVPAAKPKAPAGPTKRVLTFWRQGFTVDDGELRSYDDPAGQAFVASVQKGIAPPELLSGGGTAVDINLLDKREEDYKAPPKVLKAFSGTGQSLGTATSSTTTARPTTTTAPTTSAAPATVDESQPVTSVQIRLHDGTRLVAKFNHHHTVGDLRAFVNRAIPGGSHLKYVLQTTLPVTILNNDALTLKEAGLLNAVVVQKLV